MNLLVVWLILLKGRNLVTEAAFLGCYPEVPSARQLAVNPGNYDTALISPYICEQLCGQRGFQYAGLTARKICLCGSVLTQAVTSNSLCSEACPGDVSQSCGSISQPFVSVYTTPQILTGFKISPPGTIESYTATQIDFNVTSGIITEIKGQLHDGGIPFGPTSNLFTTVTPRRPGYIPMESHAQDISNLNASASIIVKVQSRVRLLTIDCPVSVITNIGFECYIRVGTGSHMNTTVDMGDGSTFSITLPETRTFMTGLVEGVVFAGSHPGSKLVLLPEHFMKKNGTIVGVEYIAIAPGDITIQVYRPSCSNASLIFCHQSYSCIASTENCVGQARGAKWKHTCGPTAIYNLARRQCVNRTTNELIPTPVLHTWSDMDFQAYDWVGEFVVTVTSSGRHFYGVPDLDLLTIAPGDVIGIKESGTQLQLLDATNDSYEFYWDVSGDSSYALRSTDGYTTPSATPSVLPARHAIKIFLTSPVQGKIRHTYTGGAEDLYNVTLTVTNDVTTTPAVAKTDINIQVPIQNLDFYYPNSAKTNSTIQFNVSEHLGTAPTYSWSFSDGQTNISSDKWLEKIYNEAGVYVVTLTAYNDISTYTVQREIVIQDEIMNFTAKTEVYATVYSEPTKILWSIVQGTNVSYTCLMGDGDVYVFDSNSRGWINNSVTTTPMNGTNTSNFYIQTTSNEGFEGFITYLYNQPDWYDVIIVASNMVSNATVNISIPVQSTIEGLEIANTTAIKYGTNRNVTITMTQASHTDLKVTLNGTTLNESFFNWKTNLTGKAVITVTHYSFYGYYIIEANVTNLVSPYVTFSRGVWIDFGITDLVIQNDRPFVPVGEMTLFNISMSFCSRFFTYFNFSDDTSIISIYQELLVNETYSQGHMYSLPGTYIVNLTITNPVDFYNSQYPIVVQYPVVNVDSHVMSPNRLEPNTPSAVYIQIEFLGGVPMPTSATYLIDFGDGSSYSEDFTEPIYTTIQTSPSPDISTPDTSWYNCSLLHNDSMSLNDSFVSSLLENCNMTITMAATSPTIEQPFPTTTTEVMVTKPEGYFLIPITHYYTTVGTYNVTINVTNLVSFMHFSYFVDVDEPIYELQLLPTPLYVKATFTSDLEVRMTWGSRAECTWTVGDGSPPIAMPCDRHAVQIHTYQFNVVGVYYPAVRANNTVSSEMAPSTHGAIYVQNPVNFFSVECQDEVGGKCERNIDGPKFKVPVVFNLLFESSRTRPTNASYIIDYGDGTTTVPAELPTIHQQTFYKSGPTRDLVFEFSHNYTRGGNYTTKVIIWNLVSNETYVIKHDIYEMLENLDVTIYDYDPITSIIKLGGGVGKDYFALEHQVLFKAKHSRGSHVTYEWEFGDGSSPLSVYYDKETTHQYNDDVYYYTNLTASNIRNSLTIHRIIYIQRGCFDIAVSVDDPRSKNSTFSYQFYPGTIGTEACYLFDFQDETSTPGRYQMLGYRPYCELIPEWKPYLDNPNTTFTSIDADVLYYNKTVSSPGNYNLTINTMFMTEGRYDAFLQCKNYVSHEKAFYSTGVTKGPCWWPYVNLTHPNTCSYPNCDLVVPGLRNVRRSEKLVVYSDVRINCTSTDVSWLGWRVFLVDEQYGNETEIFDLGEADTYSIACRYLQIEPRVLDYGLYRFELNVSMHEQIGMFSLDSAYIRITSTPLEVKISGGDFFTGKWGVGFPMVFDGLSEVFDPDQDPSDKTGMEFIWLCRRTCEEWPTFDSNFDVADPSTMVTTCVYQDETDRGCSKIDGVNHAGKIPNATAGLLEVMTGELYESDFIEIRLVVKKDTRQAEDSALALILVGDPPDVSLQCVTNCGKKLNPTNRYSVESIMKGWTLGVYFYYDWKLYGIPWGGSYGNRQEIPYIEWESQASTSNTGPHMALLPVVDVFLTSTYKRYYLSVKTWRWGASELNYGLAQISFQINKKPNNTIATVSVSPSSGVAYDTVFVVTSSGFKDAEDGSSFALYKFGFKRETTDSVTWFYESSQSTSEGRDTRFPDGLSSRQFKLDIVVRAYDWDGAFTEKWSTVTVHPAQPSEVNDILDTATEPGGVADKLLMASDLQVAPVANVIGKFLNDEADSALSSEQIVETTTQIATERNMTDADRLALQQQYQAEQDAKKNRRIETRAHFMNGFKRIKPPNVEAMQGTAAALDSLTKKEDELTDDAQTAAADIMDEYVVNLGNQHSLSADDREEAATGLTKVLGNVMHACGFTAEKAEQDATSLADTWQVTSTVSGVQGSTTTSAPLTEEEFALQQKTLLEKKDRAKATFERLETAMNKMIGLLSTYKVVGEKKAVAESEKLNITLDKTETQLLNQNPNVPVGGKTSVLLPKSQTLFGESDNTTTWFVETEALRIPNNPFTWTNASAGGSSTKITSDVISLKFRNHTGGHVPVANNQQNFDLFIDRSNYDTSVQSVRNATTSWDSDMLYHSISVQPDSSLHIKVTQLFDESDIQDYLDYLDGYVPDTNETDTNATEVASFFMETEPSRFYVFIRANEPPTTTVYDYNCTLEKEFTEVIEMLNYMDEYSFENDTSLPRSLYITEIPDLNTCFYSGKDLDLNETTTFYIGVKHRTYAEIDAALVTTTSPITTTTVATTTAGLKKRKKRGIFSRRRYRRRRTQTGGVSTTVGPTQPPENLEDILEQLFDQQNAEEESVTESPTKGKEKKQKKIIPEGVYKQAVYNIQIFSASCVWWDKGSNVWSSEGCKVGPLSKPYRVHCLCNHLTAFGAGFAVPMNTINLQNSGFSKLDENPVIFATMVSLMCAYLLMLIWARKKDKLDQIMAGSTPLPDNDPRDKYLYELSVFTGSRKDAGTTAKLSFILTGDKDETPPRYLADEKRPVMQRSNCDGFVLAVPKCLGKLTHLRIWHDNMGSNPSWYFSRLQVQDLQAGDKYFFICEQWLSVDEEDGLIDRMIPVAGKAELTSFNYLFWTKTKHNLADGHLWFSIFQRPARSNFTRVQRLTCCLSLLFSTMVASIAFYNTTSASPNEYKIGPVSFTLQGLYVGIMSGLMCFPINLIIVCLFRYAKPKPVKKKLYQNKHDSATDMPNSGGETKNSFTDNINSNNCYNGKHPDSSFIREKSEIHLDFIEDELEQQREYIKTGDENKRILADIPLEKKPISVHGSVNALSFEKDALTKSRGKLPYWSIYIAYILSLISVAVAFWLSVEFGGVFGMTKSLEWLMSFFVSLLESIFFSQPIKVILLAIFYALVIKKPEANDDEPLLSTSVGDDEELLHKPLTEDDLKDPQNLKLLENMKAQAPLPPQMDFLETIRKERAKELAMFSMLKEICICMVFLYFVLTIAYTNRDPWSYYMYNNIHNIFNLGAFSNNHTMDFAGIRSRDHFWNWTQNALLQGLYYTDYYNGQLSPETTIIQDMQSFLVGGARLRQLRIKPDICYSPLNYFTDECMKGYSMLREQQETYALQWAPVNTSDPIYAAHPFFTYQSWQTLDGYPYWGIFETYSGGGYVAELGGSYSNAHGVINFLRNNQWIDKYTRAVFIEANLYNPNLKLWAISMYLCEFLQTGGIETFPRFHIFRLNRYGEGEFMYFVLFVEIVTIAFVIFYTVKEIRKLKNLGKKYLTEFWNQFELFTVAVSYAIILVFIYRAVICVQIMNKIKQNPNGFTNFYFAILWDDLSGWFIGTLVFLLTIRFLRLLRFNKKIALLNSTLKYTARSLLSFLMVFLLAFLSFACTAYLFFMPTLFDFRTYMVTIETLLSMMLGKFDYGNAMSSKAGPWMFGFFSLCFSFVLINFFITILIDGFEAVRSDPVNQSNEYEVIEYMVKRFKMLLGIGNPSRKRTMPFSQDPRLNKYVYIEGKTPEQEKLGELDSKVESMILKMEGMMEKPDEDDDIETEIEAVKKKRKRKIVGSE